MTDARFDCDKFNTLNGCDLVAYVEPYLAAQQDRIPAATYEALESVIDRLDDAHTVYAIEICMLLKPDDFAGRAIEFLSHSDASVCCAAFNSVSRLSRSSLTDELVARIRATPVVDLFGPDLHSNKRIPIGTNAEFIRSLLDKYH